MGAPTILTLAIDRLGFEKTLYVSAISAVGLGLGVTFGLLTKDIVIKTNVKEN